ncbi:Rieske 2Fe-2S domain-containing protein [Pseudonocardia sp. CA-142604]|uniref:Rieske 2Fe-2S domain-containing protein n=1 Tax=Pseudonocardia sp. CA-142604 TaxID=3240024 RepID=UPI003D8E4C37
MLSHADNETICRVSKGTPMGDLMREYWLPFALGSELEPDCDPVRIMLLGERFLAIRTTSGTPVLMDEVCPHRGASMWYGRNENEGIRCVYHGWKFDGTGACVDMPNEPVGSNFKDKVRLPTYPVTEAGGLVWAYIGPRHTPPTMPSFEWFDNPEGASVAWAFQRECNWLQALEGDIDTSHFGFLHVGHADPEDAPEGSFLRYTIEDRAPRYKVLDTEFGATYGAYRPAGSEDSLYWRFAHFLFPFYTMVPTGVLGTKSQLRAWVPMDDTHTMAFHSAPGARRYTAPASQKVGITEREATATEFLPNTSDWFGRFRITARVENDHLIDRALQRSGRSYTGLAGVNIEDQAITESMGPIFDRTREHLGSSDVMVIRVRRRLLAAARALAADGTVPPAVDAPQAYQQRSGGIVLPADADWMEATAELRKAGVAHPDLDPSLAGGA